MKFHLHRCLLLSSLQIQETAGSLFLNVSMIVGNISNMCPSLTLDEACAVFNCWFAILIIFILQGFCNTPLFV